ncbi:MAG: HAD family hydrolase [Spirochaetia bacterium]|jgi:phosphoglycolate phosphatase
MIYKAVLFDLDGTLLDTLDDLGDSMNAVLASQGYATHPIRSYTTFVGDGVRNLVRRSLPAGSGKNDELVNELVPLMRREYSRRWNAKTRPYDGIPALLDGLSARGLRMAVLSNKPHPATLEVVAHFFPRWKFDSTLGARPDVPIKPDAGAALEVSRQLGVPPEAFLYLGDTNTDMKTAVAAGMFPVGVLWGFRTAEELVSSGAKVLVSDPRDVLSLLDRPAPLA